MWCDSHKTTGFLGGPLNRERKHEKKIQGGFWRSGSSGQHRGVGTAKEIADSIRAGEGVLVIHGLDYDGNGTYNFSDPEGGSELNPALPAEATDPALCGVLR